MIDLHLHLLPGIDDGAASLDVSQAMLEQARLVGFRTLVTTPHLSGKLSEAMHARVTAALAEVRSLSASHEIEVLLGYEIMLSPDLPGRLTSGEPSTLGGGTAVLVEVPLAGWPTFVDDTLFGLRVAGYRPILAHPERYRTIQEESGTAAALAERGVILQVTIGSLTGLFGREARKTAERLVRDGTAQIVATDAHSAGHRFAAVPEGLERLRDMVGEERTEQLVEGTPRALLHGGPLPAPPVPPPPKRSWLARLGIGRGEQG